MSRLFVLALLLVAGCKSPDAPPVPAVPAPPQTTARPRAPVQLSWQEVRRSATEVELIAQVKRVGRLPFPLEVSITLPPGATLAHGRARFTLAPSAEAAYHQEAVTIRFPSTPEADLELTAEGRTGDLGVHAKVPYRFGRPAPLQPVVAPVGPDLKVGEQNFGPSIPISPQRPAQAP
ncbi:MAG: hypothetical protein H6Q89_4897 [Myxococcaceae bacterium]|nr:hypothetical protein [Myxococcaceae bacterium]